MMSMSNRLQELRQQSQLSQEDLAERIGVSRQAISKWESEQSNPDIENIIRLSEIYNTSTDYILKGTQPIILQEPKKKSAYAPAFNALIIIGGCAAATILFIIGLSLIARIFGH